MQFENLVVIEITSADLASVLRILNSNNITVTNAVNTGPLTMQFSVKAADCARVKKIIHRKSSEMRIISTRGIQNILKSMIKRPVLMFCVLIITLLSLYLPTRVLFVDAMGTDSISSRYIIEKAAECGIRFGASRKLVRSEQMKNQLLAAIPQLHWAGVNTYGCVAVISVEEKSISRQHDSERFPVSNIVASYDGIITNCTVQKGSVLCRVGDAVKEGQVLVSGYTDCGIKVMATQAEAEISASTLRHLHAISPSGGLERCGEGQITRKYSLQIGKKLINFFKDSGICGSSCVKMYSKKYLTLPGGRILPIAVITEQHAHYPAEAEQAASSGTDHGLKQLAQTYLRSTMVAGEIKNEKTKISFVNNFYHLLGTYSCTEEIGKVMYERRLDHYG